MGSETEAGRAEGGLTCPGAAEETRTQAASRAGRDPSARLWACPMEERHLDAVSALERLCFAAPWTKTMFEDDVVRNPLSRYLVLLDRADPEQVVAYAGYWKIFDEGHITNVAVHPAWRRQGVGTYLMRLLIDLAAAEGIRDMTLEVRPSNEAARALYRRMGFAAEGRRPHYYADNGEDALILWRRGGKEDGHGAGATGDADSGD